MKLARLPAWPLDTVRFTLTLAVARRIPVSFGKIELVAGCRWLPGIGFLSSRDLCFVIVQRARDTLPDMAQPLLTLRASLGVLFSVRARYILLAASDDAHFQRDPDPLSGNSRTLE